MLMKARLGSPVTATVTTKSGVVITAPYNPAPGSSPGGTVTDPNGNTITTSPSGVITDTLGTALTITGTYPNPVSYTYSAPGGQASVTVYYKSYTVTTQFGVSGISEYNHSGIYLVDHITLPDGSRYSFAYEHTGDGQPCLSTCDQVTGRLAEVVLPTGGTIVYTYGSTNSMMADGSPSVMNRTLGGGTWTYDRQIRGGNPQQTWTTIIDPTNNYTDIYFSGIYPTAQSIYKGPRTTNLDYTVTCYDGNTSSCATATINLSTYISSRAISHFPGDGSVSSMTYYYYDSYGNVWDKTVNDYGGHLLETITIQPDLSLCGNDNLCDRPLNIIVGNSQQMGTSYTYYTYDNRGNTTEISRQTGVPYLNQYYSYNTNGTLATATNPNGTVTTYSYAGNSCGNAFPTSVSVPGDWEQRLRPSTFITVPVAW